ncbi:hypothetical protein T265_00238 [Opisthorchis viverrini]|uniref:Uncharacterized protein n=1 Tax=Opisthorchis viverrini TaxID=6198 RepID=A0A075AD87_OPIVI|nr:hypothetical protein T265_00238 [Opisthorchis viverrini]KER34060.1 hypothetical protein T265_00238 [Opisthorchis viverrini]
MLDEQREPQQKATRERGYSKGGITEDHRILQGRLVEKCSNKSCFQRLVKFIHGVTLAGPPESTLISFTFRIIAQDSLD